MSDNVFLPPTDPSGGGPPLGDVVDIPASAGRRFGAYMIDSLIAGAVSVPLFTVAAVYADAASQPDLLDALDGVARLASLAVMFAMTTIGEASSWRASPGKRLLGLRVVTAAQFHDIHDAPPSHDAPLDVGVVLSRNLSKIIGLSCCGLLGLTVLQAEGSSMWDNMAGTRVIRRLRMPDV